MSSENQSKKKILLAEDDAAMRRYVEITLQKTGYQVVAAEDGLAAMQHALAENFDAVVADAMMPNLSGHDLCRVLRQNPQTQRIPFILLSGLEQNETAAAAAGGPDHLADAYLLKGAKLKDELLTTLANFLARQEEAAN